MGSVASCQRRYSDEVVAQACNRMLGDWRLAILGVAVLGSLLVLMQLKPIPQDPTYHAFADQRAFLGIPSFANVISNVPFLLVGVAGWRFCHRHRQPEAPRSWTVFFLGVAMMAFGSAYYHWAPDNQTLVWDRLPMTVAFMALFVAVLAEHLSPEIEPVGLVSAIAAGTGSLAWVGMQR